MPVSLSVYINMEGEQGQSAFLNPYFQLTCSCVCLIGFMANIWCAWKIRNTYNLNLAPYLILFIGACCSGSGLLANFAIIAYIGLSGNQTRFWCTNLVAQTAVAYLVGSVILGIVSVLR